MNSWARRRPAVVPALTARVRKVRGPAVGALTARAVPAARADVLMVLLPADQARMVLLRAMDRISNPRQPRATGRSGPAAPNQLELA